MPPRKRPPPQLRHLPKVWLEALQEQCGGDWRRVYLDADGVPTVGNFAREELPPQGPTARKIRQHRAPKRTAEPDEPDPPTPMVLANAKRPPQPRGLKPAVTAAPPSQPQPERVLPSLDEARAAQRRPRQAAATSPVPPLPPPPEPELEDETPCPICGLVGAHARSCYNGLVAISGQPAPPPPTPPAAPAVAFEPPPPPVDESQLALDLDVDADDGPEDVAPELPAPEPVVTRQVITRPVFQPPPAITVNGRDIEDLPLREPGEPPRRRFGHPVVTDDSGKQWVLLEGVNGSTDWEGLSADEVVLTAHQVWLKLHEGIPPEAPMYWYDDVSALQGVDLDMVESVARQPTRVEIAPETGVKKFPVLRFWRGDVCTVVGFREPNMPKIIAAYVSSKAFSAYMDKSGQQALGKSGGGGARKSIGIPRRPRTLERRLTDMGAVVKEDTDEKTGNITATVTYKGEEMGKYRVHPCTPTQIENDWQRLQRKITAIWQRELAGKI